MNIQNYLILMIICILLTSFNNTCSAEAGSVVTVTYYSTTQGTSCNMNVYLPAGYQEDADTVNYYPVFYLIHGGGENYTHWVNSGQANTTLDTYIASGEAVPMILVMPDGKNLSPDIFSNELLNDIIPYIETNYRVIVDKDHRGVGGLSWGGLQAMEAGIYHYNFFGYLAVLSSGWFTTEVATYNRARSFLETNSTAMENTIRYLYFSEGTSSDIAYENGLATLGLLKEYGLTAHYWEHFGGHSWTAWTADFKALAPYLFRDSTTVYVALDFRGGVPKDPTIMTHIDSLIDRPANPTRTGYTFDKWYKQPECIDTFDFSADTIKKNTTIYADWNVRYYKVSFNSNGGTPITDTLSVTYNSLISAPPDPLYEGYILDGWYVDPNSGRKWNFAADRVTYSLTLFARWLDSSVISMNEDEYHNIITYPNPARSMLQIINLPSDAHLTIYSPQGKLIMQQDMKSSQASIDINNLPSGMYIMKISNNTCSVFNKIVVQAD